MKNFSRFIIAFFLFGYLLSVSQASAIASNLKTVLNESSPPLASAKGRGEGVVHNTSFQGSSTLDLVPSTLNFRGDVGTMTVVVTHVGAGDTFRANGVPSWVTGIIREGQLGTAGNVNITVSANTTTDTRMASVTLTPISGGVDGTPSILTITQTAAPFITLNPQTDNNVPHSGRTLTTTVTFGGGATGYTTSSPSWVNVPAMGTSSSVMITILPNTQVSARNNSVAFTPTGPGSGASRATLFSISQGGIPRKSVAFGPSRNVQSLRGASHEGIAVTLNVTFGGGATSYTVPMSGTGAPASWVTVPASPTDGSIEITLSANTSTSGRSNVVIFTPAGPGAGGADPTSLTIFQNAVPRTVMINPTTLGQVSHTGRTATLEVTLGGGANDYNIFAVGTWISGVKDGDGDVEVTIDQNTTPNPRTGRLILQPTGPGMGTAIPVILIVNQQAATPQTITFAPTELTNVASTGGMRTVGVMFGGGATGFTVPSSGTGAPPSWVTVPAMVDAMDDLEITIMANATTSVRSATIIFTPTGGGGTATTTSFTISQLGTAPANRTLTLAPTSLSDIAAVGATQAVTVTLGGDATGYSVPASGTGSVPSWVTGIPTTGLAGSLSIMVQANTGTARMATVTFTPTGGATGTVVPTNFTINQLAVPQTITFAPTELTNVASTGGMRTVGVMFGGGATGFTVPSSGTGSPPSWVTVPAMVDAMNDLEITILANTGTSPRSATIIFTPTGGGGTATPASFTINQQAIPQTITLTPNELDGVLSAGEMRTVGVMFGGGATGFTVPSSGTGAPPSWVTVPAMVDAMDDLEITIMENTTTSTRSAMIIFTPTGGSGMATPASFTINQQAIPQTITLTPNELDDVLAAGEMRTVGVMFGGGATGFTVPSSGTGAPPSWVTVPAMVDAMDDLEITIMANATTSVRSAMIIFTPTGGSGMATTATLTINQQATPQTITLTPNELDDVLAAGEMRTVGVMFGGGATGFTVPSSGTGAPPSWVTVPAMVDAMDDLEITVRANMTAMTRSATIVFTPTGGGGTATPASLTINQQATPQTITLTPNELDGVLAAGEMRTVGVMFGGGATGFTVPSSGTGAPPSWVTVPAMVDAMDDLEITVRANMTAMTRSATIVFTPTGGGGTATPASLTINQQATPQTITLTPNELDGVLAAGEMRTVGVMFGGGATGFTVPSSGTGCTALLGDGASDG